MKVLLIHSFFQNFNGEDALALAAKKLLEDHGHECIFYTQDNSETNNYTWQQKARFPLETIHSKRTVRDIKKIAQDNIDVAYIHNIYPLISPSVYFTLRELEIPIVQIIHNYRFLCPNGYFFINGKPCEKCKTGAFHNAVRQRCYRNSYVFSSLYAFMIWRLRRSGIIDQIDAVICNTDFMRQKFIEAGISDKNIYIKPNFIETDHIESRPGSGDYVLYLGRLSEEKGLRPLLEVFEQLRDIPLKIAGTGPLDTELRQYVEQKKMHHVEFLGFLSGAEKAQALENSLFTVVPSIWYDNFPVSLLEAYAAGKPVLASNSGCFPHIVEEGRSGLLFERGNSAALAEKIRWLYQHPNELTTMGRYARQLVETRYSPEATYQTLLAIFNQVRNSGRTNQPPATSVQDKAI